jgi:hypothetical protein
MSPKGEPRDRKFTLVMTDEERLMLDALSVEEQRTASDWIRLRIREAFAARFGPKKPKR